MRNALFVGLCMVACLTLLACSSKNANLTSGLGGTPLATVTPSVTAAANSDQTTTSGGTPRPATAAFGTTPPTAATAAASPSATRAPAPTGLTIYADARAANWIDESFNATVDYNNTAVVYSGTRAIAFTVTAPNGHLLLHTDIPVDMAQFAVLRFAARATQAGQRYAIALYDANSRQIGMPRPMADLGGDPPADRWNYYQIALKDLGGAGVKVTGIEIIDDLGQAQPPLYIDDLGFS